MMQKKKTCSESKNTGLLDSKEVSAEEKNAYATYINFNYGQVSERYYNADKAEAKMPGKESGDQKSLLN